VPFAGLPEDGIAHADLSSLLGLAANPTFAFDDGEPGLVVRQRALPNREPFSEAEVIYRDPSVTALKFAYMDEGGWKDTWDGAEAKATPRAVRITVATSINYTNSRSYQFSISPEEGRNPRP